MFFIFITGCTHNPWLTKTLPAKSSEHRCDPPPTPLPLDIPVQPPPPTLFEQPTYSGISPSNLGQVFSRQALQIADILKLRPLLDLLATVEQQVKSGSIKESELLRMIYIREKIVSRITLASLGVVSVSSEAACEAHGRTGRQPVLK